MLHNRFSEGLEHQIELQKFLVLVQIHGPPSLPYLYYCNKEITISFFLFSACNQAGLGIAAIFGPQNPDIAGHINSMCNTLEIPHIEVRLEPERNSEQLPLFSMNVYPETRQLSRAYLELLKLFQWNKFCVMYGDQRGKLTMPFLFNRTPDSGKVLP